MTAESVPCAACQEVTDEERFAQLDDVLKQYASVPGALIPVLQITQAIFGYLPEAALRKISLTLHKPYSEVAGVVGFYSFFTTVPRGRHIVRVCLGTACYVRGGKEVLVLAEARAACRGGGDDTRPDVFVGRRPLFRRLRHGPGHHDRRRRASARAAGPLTEDPRTVSRRRATWRLDPGGRMTKRLANPTQLAELRDSRAGRQQEARSRGNRLIRICMGASCIASGARRVKQALENAMQRQGLTHTRTSVRSRLSRPLFRRAGGRHRRCLLRTRAAGGLQRSGAFSTWAKGSRSSV